VGEKRGNDMKHILLEGGRPGRAVHDYGFHKRRGKVIYRPRTLTRKGRGKGRVGGESHLYLPCGGGRPRKRVHLSERIELLRERKKYLHKEVCAKGKGGSGWFERRFRKVWGTEFKERGRRGEGGSGRRSLVGLIASAGRRRCGKRRAAEKGGRMGSERTLFFTREEKEDFFDRPRQASEGDKRQERTELIFKKKEK